MVEVFKTNVQKQKEAKMILPVLSKSFPALRINFDLDDCDRILRVEGSVNPEKVIKLLRSNGYECKVLD